ncbi:MAG: hypothetical protein AAF138_04210 [Planctomycetota bacterium]
MKREQPAPEPKHEHAPPPRDSVRPLPADRSRDLVSLWERVRTQAEGRTLGAILNKSALINLDGGRAVVETDHSVRSAAEDRIGALEQLVARAAGEPVQIELRAASRAGHDADDDGPREAPMPSADEITARPLVRETLAAFDGKIARVTPRRPADTQPTEGTD